MWSTNEKWTFTVIVQLKNSTTMFLHVPPLSFELIWMLHCGLCGQVRYLNLIETVHVWRSGHCYRLPYVQFLSRYKMICSHTWPKWRGSPVEGVTVLLRSLPIPSAEFTFGRSKIFVRSPRTVFELEDFRRMRLNDLALLIQKCWRGHREYVKYRRIIRSQRIIAKAWRSWRVSCGSGGGLWWGTCKFCGFHLESRSKISFTLLQAYYFNLRSHIDSWAA